ncbi:ribosome-binding factor A [Proteiniborus ethanoligenes]|uniref:Ribosome-binding factor A n=1 Tax=Proteiniborus ethanoligenes TaxID=415015 RepID=A0A1H3N7Z5_9FIRM|nr:30S ribosome-binding factor RbfA [Proteiniborus ethanoligenes]TAH63737.1 MAG: 30S ribosome-binding factor RbfA [Gottschalkiaceae bacterium]SDY84595.1 ribosome-binding factor A [Proteiniborus ethanoligenes]
MSLKRIGRISEEIKRIVSNVIMTELKDPRISSMTSVTLVEVTRDLRYAKIYISVLGNESEISDTIKGLESSKGFIRKEIGKNLNLRYTPEPMFYLDKSIEHGFQISKILNEIKSDEKKGKDGDE